ncbi:MAG: hypothetical protein KGJ13_04545 [Patescibacteria group bacterium]|nr:hypothetical protein [Patescibacteria group bacterium]
MAVTKLPANTYPITAQDQAAVPYVQGVPSETARFLQDLHGMGVAAVALDGVQKPYLNGTGTIVAFSNDNIQVFEFPAAQIASEAAAQIFKKAPRLKREPDFFHVFTEGKLVVLYFGHNQDVIAVTRQVVAR